MNTYTKKLADYNTYVWRETLENELGATNDTVLAELHSCSDYDSYGEYSALRDANHDGFIKWLKENEIEYVVLTGAYWTRVIVARVDNDEQAELIEDLMYAFDGYPVVNDDLHSEYQTREEQNAIDEFIKRYDLGEAEAEIIYKNLPENGWKYGLDYPDESELESILCANGYAKVGTSELVKLDSAYPEEIPAGAFKAAYNSEGDVWLGGYAFYTHAEPTTKKLYSIVGDYTSRESYDLRYTFVDNTGHGWHNIPQDEIYNQE